MSFRTYVLCLAAACACAACSNKLPTSAPSTTPSTPAAITALTGRVVQAGTTNGIASAALTLVDSSGNALTMTTDATGAFSFANLSAGTYTLQAAAPGFLTSTSTLTFPVQSYTVQLPPAGSAPVSTLKVAITGPAALAIGRTSQLTANVVYTDGSQKDVTNVAKWTSSNPSVATVSSSGLLTARSIGTATINAAFQDVSGALTVSTTSQ